MYRDLRTIEFEARAVFTTMTKMRSKIEGFSRDSRLEFVHENACSLLLESFRNEKIGSGFTKRRNLREKFFLEKKNFFQASNNKFLNRFEN